ncbi:MAG: transketolase [Acidobacteriota bacterium]
MSEAARSDHDDSARVDADRVAIDTLRFLAVDMVEAARSGHPGAPMGQAALAYRLWTRALRHDPMTPDWPNRDRFVLSCGHASALIYGLLHLSGYDLPLEQLQAFRQLGSKTPGHPENFVTPGVETTTGPLGQGLATAVGMAIAERYLASHFNRDGLEIVDHRIWVLASDGDLMEGVAAEASSLAGHLGLGRLVVFWDDNRITIDGSTDLAFGEDVMARYAAYGWHVDEIEDGNDLEAIDRVLDAAREPVDRPVLVRVRTHIGYGSPNKQDTAGAHGAPLGPDEVKATKEALGWPLEPTFHVPDAARDAFARARRQGADLRASWRELFERYRGAHPELAARFEAWGRGELGDAWRTALPHFTTGESMATRKASGKVLTAIAEHLPQLLGGSADLAGSNNTYVPGRAVQSATEPGGANFHFGVREHAMAAAANGMALSGLRPYVGTFLIFSDYMRPSIRLAALMGTPAIYVLTHDSIFLGEDGPTHQPVSHLASLRAIPNLVTLRPADANEVAAAWAVALERTDGPTALALTRQGLPVLAEIAERAADGVARGAYVIANGVIADGSADPSSLDLLLLATGSEVHLALEAHRRLADDGVTSRVVSMPSWELFDAQSADYRASVLPAGVPRLGIEAGSGFGWHKYVGLDGALLTQDGYGASAPLADLREHFGFTADEVVRRARTLLGN